MSEEHGAGQVAVVVDAGAERGTETRPESAGRPGCSVHLVLILDFIERSTEFLRGEAIELRDQDAGGTTPPS